MLDVSYGLVNTGDPEAQDLWPTSGSPLPVDRRDVTVGEAGQVSPSYGEAVMNSLTFPPLEFESLPSSFLSSSYREYPLFKSEKSTHDIADALLSLKHAVVHPQFGGPLSPSSALSPPPMPHLGHHTSGQGGVPCGGPPSPGLQPTPHGITAGYGPSHSHSGQSLLHTSYGVGVGVGVGVGTQLYGQQYPEPCSSPILHQPPSHPPPPPGLAPPPPPPPPHPSQATGMPFPAMSVNVSMSMNVGMTHGLHAPPTTYNYGPPPHQQWPPPPSPAQPSTPPPLAPQYHHGSGFSAGVSQYSGYAPTQFPGSQSHPMSGYPATSYSIGPPGGDTRSFYYKSCGGGDFSGNDSKFYYKSGGGDTYKDPGARYCSVRHPHHHLHDDPEGGLLHGKRSKILSDKVAMAAAAAAAVSVTGSGATTAGMVMGVGVGESPLGLGTHTHHPQHNPHHHHHHHHHHQGLLKTNLCRICGKTYARPSTLKTHLRTHSGEKPYKCNTCNKSFSQAANLTAHIRTHSGEKPFRCPICDRRFSQSSSVTTHMRTHSGDRPYRCRLCKKAFSDSSTLTKHLRIHSGEKPYQCKLCLLRFSQSGNLNRHMRVHANQA